MKEEISKIHYSSIIDTGNMMSDFRVAQEKLSAAGIDVIGTNLGGYISFNTEQVDMVDDFINVPKTEMHIKDIHVFSRRDGSYAIDAKINGVKVGPAKIDKEDVTLGFEGKHKELAIKYLITQSHVKPKIVHKSKSDEQYNAQYMRISRNIIREHSLIPNNSSYLTSQGLNRLSIVSNAYIDGIIANRDQALKPVKSAMLKRAERCVADNKQNKQAVCAEVTKGHNH